MTLLTILFPTLIGVSGLKVIKLFILVLNKGLYNWVLWVVFLLVHNYLKIVQSAFMYLTNCLIISVHIHTSMTNIA